MIKRENIAKVCHEVNRAYCQSIGDNSHKSWEDCGDETQLSALKGVDFILENPNATPKSQHDKWWIDKVDSGWQLGSVKNEESKTHPSMVFYHELPQEEISKDYIFQQIVKSLMTVSLMDAVL